MSISKVLSFSSFFLLILSKISAMVKDCSNSRCSPFEVDVRFPFRLKDLQPEYCGYPGYNLTCKVSSGETILELPMLGEFLVRDISYVNKQIRLKDPDDCLAKRLLDFNLSGSPFKSAYYQNYTFLNCSSEIEYVSNVVSCLSSDKHKVLAIYSRDLVSSFYRNCEVIKNISVPVLLPEVRWNRFTVSWDEPDCQYCEGWDGMCRLRSNNNTQEICSRKNRFATGIICIMSISIGLSAMCWIYFTTTCLKAAYGGDHQPSTAELSTVISPQAVVLVIGLNESIIESYPKIVLGDSRRLPKPDDSTCPICLSEYRPKETLKIIPECNHGFHADCIDEWLHMNMTCPVCRNSPNHQHPAHAT